MSTFAFIPGTMTRITFEVGVVVPVGQGIPRPRSPLQAPNVALGNITVENGGKLIIDGGVITNADIQLQSGSQLQLLNGGVVVVRTDSDFYAPIGSVVSATYGKICKSSDFSSF